MVQQPPTSLNVHYHHPQQVKSLFVILTFPPVPGWKRSKRRRSSSGKRQIRRLQNAWLSWVPSPSPPTCWQRRWMKICCSSDGAPSVRQSPTSPVNLFILCLSGQVYVFSCKWWKLLLLFFCVLVVDDLFYHFSAGRYCVVFCFPDVSLYRTKHLAVPPRKGVS